ncbi:hypothetical protein TRIATDRAFT_259749 [Trichoderma atroviride IMI 206040]|uniref:Uncharacterized protein n=1 Tax=Hypocrea atroviridis (strain ATCC 20476 / IMI 206040) TaxID=452589 RepID=G9P6E0_HYPAI|nr:uncharacterized protein TRIATDRAFT_259749 [Trichoderma atroviride IMI 206040]EHK42255.1 hypothetical protein TRIATDRAFT_259749 [Trichoderma atroviride IMI 206040]
MSTSHQDVSFQTFDGVTLKGWFFQASAEKSPCIIMTHGVCLMDDVGKKCLKS